MTRLESLVEQLPIAKREQVENYVASLLAEWENTAPLENGQPNRIRLEELDSLLTKMTDEMPWPEIKIRLRNAWADAAED